MKATLRGESLRTDPFTPIARFSPLGAGDSEASVDVEPEALGTRGAGRAGCGDLDDLDEEDACEGPGRPEAGEGAGRDAAAAGSERGGISQP